MLAPEHEPLLPTPPDERGRRKRGAPELASPRPTPRPRLGEGDTPSTATTPPSASGASSSSSPAAASSASASSPAAPLRVRLRGKTTPPPVAAEPAAIPAPADGLPELPEEWRFWAGDLEDMEAHRACYFVFRRRMQQWVRGAAGELSAADALTPRGVLLQRANAAWRSLGAVSKGQLVQEYLLAEAPPAKVAEWARLLWPVADKRGENPRKKGGWLYSKSVMLTWNGDFGTRPAGFADPSATVEDVVRMLRDEPTASATWARLGELRDALLRMYPGCEWAMAQELCVETWTESREVRFHLHMFLRSESKLWAATPVAFEFEGNVPHKSAGVPLLVSRAISGNAGVYYLTAPKKGSIRSASLRKPFSHFSISPDWITALVSADKMSIADARQQTIQAGRSLQRKLGDLALLQQCREEERLAARMAEIQEELGKRARPSRCIAEIEEWKKQALQPFQSRKRFLVIEGPSGLGKTEYVRQLCGASRTLELNCASCGTSPDLRAHRPAQHQLILFDEGTPRLVLANKKLFQCPACLIDLGHSPTGSHVYKVFLNDSCCVVASNTWTAEVAALELEADRQWLAANAVVVKVSEPMWQAAEPDASPVD